MGIQKGSVYKEKSELKKKLREIIKELIDDPADPRKMA
jgi:regulator of RNase E activity RraB